MKKKLALLMAAIMTVAMVPMTAFASTKLEVFDLPTVAEDAEFSTIVELQKDNSQTDVSKSDYWLVDGGTYYDSNGENEAQSSVYVARPTFQVKLTLTNGEFTETASGSTYDYEIEAYYNAALKADYEANIAGDTESGVMAVKVLNSKTAIITLDLTTFNQSTLVKTSRGVLTVDDGELSGNEYESYIKPFGEACVLEIFATAGETGEVEATFAKYSGTGFTGKSATIAVVSSDEVAVSVDGVTTFVEDSDRTKEIDLITIEGLVNGAITQGTPITLKLSGNYTFNIVELDTSKSTEQTDYGYANYVCDETDPIDPEYTTYYALADEDGDPLYVSEVITTLNNFFKCTIEVVDDDEIIITPTYVEDDDLVDIILSGICLVASKSASAGDVAKIKVSSKDFKSVTLEVAKMVEEAVTYSVDDDDLPRLWAGQLPANNEDNEGESLTVYIEENTGDILNTSRKATFTFPDGIEVAGINFDGVYNPLDLAEGATSSAYNFRYEIDENVVTIWNYGEDNESDATDMEISFILSAAPSYEGDVTVVLGGEFDDVEFTVATVEAPYTIEAKTSEVLIDYRYVPVNEIVITEAEAGLLVDDAVIYLEVEKMDFEDAGTYEVTEGDIEVEVEIESGNSDLAQLKITVEDSSTEASTITISGLELYLDRTLPVGGYALKNVMAFDDNDDYDLESGEVVNILWENSAYEEGDAATANEAVKEETDPTDDDAMIYDTNGIFKYKAVTVNDSYVEVVTAARDQDDSTTSRKIVITIGATTMSVGTETVTLDAPAYINSEDYTMLPVRAISEAFGATVTWDDASKTVTVLSGQRIISMTIGSKTMYINGTPIAMNTAAEITNDRTFIPVRDLANSLGISAIDWNEASATVTLN